MTTWIGYYVDEGSGKVCSTETPPAGCRFELHETLDCREIRIVAEDGKILQANVFWPSLEALADAGVDVTRLVIRVIHCKFHMVGSMFSFPQWNRMRMR